MTVISAIISSNCISVSSDSFLTTYNTRTKKSIALETQFPKLIPIEKKEAVICYWGYAGKLNSKKNTIYNWLVDQSRSSEKFSSLEVFAKNLKIELEKEITKHKVSKKDSGIGIHLVGYEKENGNRWPELFLISNFKNPQYTKIGNMGISRNLYKTLPKDWKLKNKNLNGQRLIVRDFLRKGKMFIFNNGDPYMFNPISKGYLSSMKIIKERKLLRNPSDIETYRALARRPVEFVSESQLDFCKPQTRIVGGRIHDAVIEKRTGKISSNSGIFKFMNKQLILKKVKNNRRKLR